MFLYLRSKYNTFYYKESRFYQGNKSPFTVQRFTDLALSPIIMESTIPIFITFCYLWDWFEYIWVFQFLCFLLSCSLQFCFAQQLRANTHWPRCTSELHPYSFSMVHEQLTSRGIAATVSCTICLPCVPLMGDWVGAQLQWWSLSFWSERTEAVEKGKERKVTSTWPPGLRD